MKIALDCRPVSEPNELGRYSRCLLGALRETAGHGDEVLDVHRPLAAIRAGRPDVFHTPWIDGAMLHSPCPMVVTVHSLSKHARRSEHLRTGLRMRMRPLAVQRAVRVIVPSEAVARDAILHLHLERARVTVIPQAADDSMYRRDPVEVAQARSRYGLPERYLVWVGGLQHPDPDKHLAELARTPRELPLVLVGATRPWAHELPSVTLTGRVPDGDLAAIYSGAHALVVSSGKEGFGLPAVEALACGTPVVACEGPALREVLGTRATFVPRGDMRGLIEAAQEARRPAPPALAWTWRDAATRTWDVYREAGEAALLTGARTRRRRNGGRGPSVASRPGGELETR